MFVWLRKPEFRFIVEPEPSRVGGWGGIICLMIESGSGCCVFNKPTTQTARRKLKEVVLIYLVVYPAEERKKGAEVKLSTTKAHEALICSV